MSRSIAAQGSSAPDTIAVTVGSLTVRGLVWRPGGTGPFPAVLFNHGSYRSADPMSDNAPGVLGPVFAQHGFVFLVLFRQGIGLSRGRGTADGDLMARALAAEGIAGRNRVQLQLLEGEEFHEALAGLAFLRSLPAVDVHRVAIVGHSFGGSLALLVAARDTAIRAAVVFGAAAASWNESPLLRARLLTAVRRTHAPVLFIHAANDYSLAPGKALASEMQRLRKPHRLKVYPAIGHESRDGHNLVYRSLSTWESDVFSFLATHLQR